MRNNPENRVGIFPTAYLNAGQWLWCWVPLASTGECLCRDTQPRSSFFLRSTDDAITHRTGRDRHTVTHKDAHLRSQTSVCLFCKVRQNQKSDTQKDRATDSNCEVTHLVDVTQASRSCQRADGARLCLVAIAHGHATSGTPRTILYTTLNTTIDILLHPC